LAGNHGETAAILAAKRGHVDVLRVLLPAAIPKPTPSSTVDGVTEPVLKPASAEAKSRSGSRAGSRGSSRASSSNTGKAKGTGVALPPIDLQTDSSPPTLRQILCDKQDENGMTALMWAAHNGRADIVAELLKYTSDTDRGEIK
jgi:ankyrin repeat protein